VREESSVRTLLFGSMLLPSCSPRRLWGHLQQCGKVYELFYWHLVSCSHERSEVLLPINFLSDLNILLVCVPISVRLIYSSSLYFFSSLALTSGESVGTPFRLAQPAHARLSLCVVFLRSVLAVSTNFTSLVSGHHTSRQGGLLA
jgi:hypothetical protein